METQTWGTCQPVVIQKIFPILLCQSLSIPDILYCQFNIFPFKLLLVSLPTLPPTLKQINIAWPMTWSTLHISLYRKVLCFIKPFLTIVDGRRGREQRGILKCTIVFNASSHFVIQYSMFSYRRLQYEKLKSKHHLIDTKSLFVGITCVS